MSWLGALLAAFGVLFLLGAFVVLASAGAQWAVEQTGLTPNAIAFILFVAFVFWLIPSRIE